MYLILAYSSSDPWGVPLLDLGMQASELVQPFVRWGRIHRADVHMPGTWHFYTDDYRFNGIWSRPDLVPKSGAGI
jgi:hypothetical protein